MATSEYADFFWESSEGLKLHARDYAGAADRPAILCLPGLTRNARDFEPVAEAFAGQWRVLALDFRGRGESDYAKESDSYVPLTYVADVLALVDELKLDKVVAIGTSLGGIVTTLIALQRPDLFAGVVLNDIGPVIESEGLERIRDHVGHGRSFPTWMHAARALRDSSQAIYPDYAIEDWLALAKRLMCVGNNGRIAYDYDMKIAEPFSDPAAAEAVDLWPAFEALGGRPGLVLRGELSDLFSPVTFAAMGTRLAGFDCVTVPRVGHAPTLAEPEAQAAIARLLGRVLAA
ncbi:alpha/beta hydrolase [Aurantiacibacter xanthus]|uniref:Alpha/beta hydrolase n=2 Tax=Aurantiacibacter xanthus TaxID=1784712 RepID=A0A3A1P779_9SPHN|nr:alpha/beta hydrolase [Aurantiacibacter xanthus]RIV85236.1 alpha/beta hydrolase [Aurantiacibacter xanthus]